MERRRKNGRKKDDGGALTRVVEVGGAPASTEKRPWRLACLPACLLRLRGNRAKQGQTYRYSCVCGAAAPGSRRRETLPPVIRQGAFGLLGNFYPGYSHSLDSLSLFFSRVSLIVWFCELLIVCLFVWLLVVCLFVWFVLI
jgi:hypothetical protein